ncbi:MAG: FAD-binding oxidoreductase [Flavobacterium sp.]|uniref:NAD(P)/FAD-dependent oxidoreductase n=1 Tax=Flavobacterium sp. TaxID=239 RepID=UPI001202F770|nr:FAD-dependent oxidoreductase [Flavobacterium sp.]RZJ66407.1 MAG: FAD-binding oxidoreductase [Flavobacterium sp.]
MKDYLIIGAGLAGTAFAETAIKHGKSILVFDNDSLHSSQTAAGVYNPVILKRFSRLNGAQAQLDVMHRFYDEIESRVGITCNFPTPILRKFASVEEQNNWFNAADKEGLSPFLSTQLIRENIEGIDSPFDFGLVLQTGYVDTEAFLERYRRYLQQSDSYAKETFDFSKIIFHEDFISYKGIQARHIVFAEGFGIKSNPYFNYFPLEGTKGELLTIKAQMGLKSIIKGGVFVLPIGNDLYKVGATYNWDDKTEIPTESAKQEIIEKLREIINVDFEIVDHKAAIRPTVKDRKPLIGTHPEHKQLHILNGLGTRGVMLGPTMAQLLFDSIENGSEIPREFDIKRFA